MTDITPAQIIADAPLGALIAFSDGTARPPERFNKRLSAWKQKNDVGTLVEVRPDHGTFTLHMGDLAAQGTIVMRVYRTADLNSRLSYTLVRRAPQGAILCANLWAGKRKIDKVTDEAGGRRWHENNIYGELLAVGADGALTVIQAARQAA